MDGERARRSFVVCPEHAHCVAELQTALRTDRTPIAAPEWAKTWFIQEPERDIVAIAHHEADLRSDGLLPQPQAVPRKRWWRK